MPCGTLDSRFGSAPNTNLAEEQDGRLNLEPSDRPLAWGFLTTESGSTDLATSPASGPPLPLGEAIGKPAREREDG